MSKGALIIFILVLILAGAGYLFWADKANAPVDGEVPNETAGTTEGTPEMPKKEGPLSLFMLGGVESTCSFTPLEKAAFESGTLYVSGSDVRVDIVKKEGGTEVETHLVAKGEQFYTWVGDAKTGSKAPRDVATGQATGKMVQGGFDTSVVIAYDCKEEKPDAARFTLPTNITFADATVVDVQAGAR